MANAHLQQSARATRWLRIIAAWLLSVVLAFLFVMAGGMKLVSRPNMVAEFNQVGLGQWFRYFTGTLEVTGAIGVLIPAVSSWAALLLSVVMVGAIVAHLTVLNSPPTLPAVLLALALALAWLRRGTMNGS